ncbi:hypothetical protein BDN72DRAFT_959209 [Pluteus cervinus]|uniref:Uncharacterized protein n=1 Tax=Pluteus cervinus TaxID=181527 RepID=A0ACD3AW98_9AGAR|nr:hypothetical protein BDN72DRAFT_959209 [Pluteus cervinus]
MLYFVGVIPPEITDHILGFLHPLDLYHLIQTTKDLRKLLLTPKAGPCWQDSFLNHPNFPSFPTGCSPPRWVNLLFEDPTRCGFCNTKMTEIIEAVHLHQLCSYCPSALYIVHGFQYTSLFLRIASIIHPPLAINTEIEIASTLLLPTSRFCIDGSIDGLTPQIYWKTEAEEMTRTYLTWRRRVLLEEEGAQSAFDAYIAERTEFINETYRRTETYMTWANHTNNSIKSRDARRHQVNLAKIKAQFVREGFTQKDLQSPKLRDYFSVQALCTFRRLTGARWYRYHATVRPILDDIKELRLMDERYSLFLRRYNTLTVMYNAYVLRLRRSDIPLVPISLPILGFQRVQDVLFDESNAGVDERVCEGLMFDFADEMMRWKDKRSREVAGDVVREYRDVVERCGLNRQNPTHSGSLSKAVKRCGDLIQSALEPHRPDASNQIQAASAGPRNLTPAESQIILQLPFAIFTCNSKHCHHHTHPLFGYDEIAQHFGCQSSASADSVWSFTRSHMAEAQPDLNLSKLHSEFMFEFVRDKLEVDPYVTTVRELDESGERFVCETCGVVNGGMEAYSWRECARHYQEVRWRRHSVSSFVRLSTEAAGEVARREIPDRGGRFWTCVLCPTWVNTLQNHQDVKAHVEKEHSIARPYRGVHFINRSTRTSRRKPAKLCHSGVTRTDRICNRCPPGKKKLWSARALTSHLRYKHQIENMTAQDYRIVKVLVTDPD